MIFVLSWLLESGSKWSRRAFPTTSRKAKLSSLRVITDVFWKWKRTERKSKLTNPFWKLSCLQTDEKSKFWYFFKFYSFLRIFSLLIMYKEWIKQHSSDFCKSHFFSLEIVVNHLFGNQCQSTINVQITFCKSLLTV